MSHSLLGGLYSKSLGCDKMTNNLPSPTGRTEPVNSWNQAVAEILETIGASTVVKEDPDVALVGKGHLTIDHALQASAGGKSNVLLSFYHSGSLRLCTVVSYSASQVRG